MQRDPKSLGREYYEELKAIEGGMPQCPRYLKELEEAIGPIAPGGPNCKALEIGPGASMYAPEILRKGYHYDVVEPSPWAAEYCRKAYLARAYEGEFCRFDAPRGYYSLILAAHAFEHLVEGPAAIVACAELLKTEGYLYAVVPDDSDPCNPDHLWFYNEDSLVRIVRQAGLRVLRVAMRKVVTHENFIYLLATKDMVDDRTAPDRTI